MIKTVAHCGDIHIYSNERHDEYREQFNRTYDLLRVQKPDRIVVAGDLLQTFVISNEAKILASEFLNSLCELTERVIIFPGNHDIFKKNFTKINTVETLVKIIDNPKILYFGESCFHEDENVVWVNHSHLQKDINPWYNIDHVRDESKIYIDLFHDPIRGCSTDLGQTFDSEHYRGLNDFKGDLVMMGDIHKLSWFRDDKTMAYSSSLIQQNFGEFPENHGYLLWDIINKTSKFIEVPNDQIYLNLFINKDVDYDDLEIHSGLEVKYPNKKLKVKVKWSDYTQNINNIQYEAKITKFLEGKYDIISLDYDKTDISKSIENVDVDENVDINDPEQIKNIFIEYLTNNNHSEDLISEILDLDNKIDNRLETIDSVNTTWNIDKIWFDNFKSYGDDNIIEWSSKSGIFEISGPNQIGKTTILDAICYCLYGKTMGTTTKEKYGDNRFINNKRDKDGCLVGMIITINQEKIGMVRETKRTFNKKGLINSAPTSLSFYKVVDGEIDYEQELSNEETTKTNNIVNSVIGTFDDFIRMVLTTADNLNTLLSVNRSEFIDSILRDAGWDIFEKKLDEFKEWKKEFNEDNPRFKLDIKVTNSTIESYQTEIKDKELSIESLNNSKEENNKRLLSFNNEKDNFNKEIIKISDPVDIDSVNTEIVNIDSLINEKNNLISNFDTDKNEMITSFDQDSYDKLSKDINVKNEELSSTKLKSSEKLNELNKIEYDFERLESIKTNAITERKTEINNIIQEKTIDINNIKSDIKEFRSDSNNKCTEVLSKYTTELNNITNQISNKNNEVTKIKLDITNLENSKVCVTCERELKEEDLLNIKNKIDGYLSDIKKLEEELIVLNQNLEIINTKIKSVKGKQEKIKSDDWRSLFPNDEKLNDLLLKYKTINSEITVLNENVLNIDSDSIIVEKFNQASVKFNELDLKKKQISNEISEFESKIIKINSDIDKLTLDKIKLDELKTKYNKYLELSKNVDKIPLEIENLKLKKEIQEKLKDKYNKDLLTISKNREIEGKISIIEQQINAIHDDNNMVDSSLLSLKTDIKSLEDKIEGLNNDLTRFKRREEIEIMHNIYKDLLSRDGVPMILLRNSIHIINNELSNLMTDLDFIVYFNDDMELLMSMKSRLDVCQNVIESSGKERTFSAVCLKIALSQINKKSKPNFILLDEIMGKLADKSVEEFITLLDVIKTKVDKVIIVEHNHNINWDYRIDVKKENLISQLELI